MSVQFGSWHFDGKPIAEDYLERVRDFLTPFGPDAGSSYSAAGLSILYRAFHTTSESRRETQPYLSKSGAVITWDGRLDNRLEFIRALPEVLTPESTDLDVVAAAYGKWEQRSFARLIGDWALSIWNHRDGSLLLARDFIGVRHLYYVLEDNQVSWSTILDPLVLLSERPVQLDEEYMAGWLATYPAADRTPYRRILSVPASSYVHIRDGKATVQPYWTFDPNQQIRHRTDTEYEEHFRWLFRQAVRRRLRSDSPIVAELSGGMDSSSIVCMADTILADDRAVTPRLDTVSYFDPSEPHWDERPYFEKVEASRGRAGCHIDVAGQTASYSEYSPDHIAATPCSGAHPTRAAREFADCLTSHGNRVLLSGIGGDEVLGGVPTAIPELADLLATGKLCGLVRRAGAWALPKRRPLLHVLAETIRAFLPPTLVEIMTSERPASWLAREFVCRRKAALHRNPGRLKLFGPLPSFQENIAGLDVLRRQLACASLSSRPCYERRYPYLDRDLLEYLFAIPREQIVLPGQRRSLMRRAMAGIVPDEVLHRRRKAFVSRGPIAAAPADWKRLLVLTDGMLCSSLGIVNAAAFEEVLHRARQGQDFPLVTLLRTIRLEHWLRHLRATGLFDVSGDPAGRVVTGSGWRFGRALPGEGRVQDSGVARPEEEKV